MNQENLNAELKTVKKKSAKPMLWISMISMIMFFAGLTSAYVVSRKREDWVSFDLPISFYTSTILIILSSVVLILAQKSIRKNNRQLASLLILTAFALGIAFVFFQYDGFNQLRSVGLFFTGPESTVSTSFIIGITFMHVLHVLAGLIVLLVVIYNHFKSKYNTAEMLGFELGAIFWHFVGILWIYLFFFFYFIR